MTSELKEYIDSLYAEYHPLRESSKQLLSTSSESTFRDLTQERIQHLEEGQQQEIINELFGWGPLTDLIHRQDIFDILIQGPQHIYFETESGMKKLKKEFACDRSFQTFIDKLINESELLINHKSPFANGKWKDFRLHMMIPPASQHITITLRKHRLKQWPLTDLLAHGFLTPKQYEHIQWIIAERKNTLIIGPTGSGKTTFLNSLLKELSDTERSIIIEDTDELLAPSPLSAKLLSRELCPNSLTPYSMEDLLKQALRMRPDRLVIGEVRGSEAKDLLQALATGHSGSLGTLHARSAHQALLRLEMLIQMGAPQWSLHSIRQLIQMSVDYLIVLKEDRQSKGILDICKMGSHEKFGLLLESLES